MAPLGQLFVGLLAIATAAAKPWPVQKYKSQNFTAPGFKITSTGTATADGSIFLGYFKTADKKQAPLIMQDDGELVWHGPVAGDNYNFRRQLLNNKIVLTYWSGYLDYQGHGYGSVTILDNEYKQLYDLCLPESENSKVVTLRAPKGTTCFMDKHESLITPSGTILVTTYNATQTDLTSVGGDANGWVFDCLFYEMDVATQDIKFKWSALDHVPVGKSNFINTTDGANKLDLNGRTYGTQHQPWDYFHINSVQDVPGGYILNSRMTWSTYMINTTGDIQWTLEGSNGGDFTLGPGIFFSWQHMPRLDPSASTNNILHISLFNNDNIPHVAQGVNTSTGYDLEVNLNTMHVTALKDLTPANPLYGVAEGSYQVLNNDHSLVGYGAVPVFEEYVGTDRIYTAQFAPNDGEAHSYRTYRFPWTSVPKSDPSAAAEILSAKPKVIHVYASWNGATTYDSWNIYAGTTQAAMKKVASNVAKKGFETAHQIKNSASGYQYIIVEALAKGKSLGKSQAVAIDGASTTRLVSGLQSAVQSIVGS